MLNPLRDANLVHLGAEAFGIVHLDECRAAGLSHSKLDWLVRTGRWRYVFPRVLATFSGPVPYEAMLVAAVKYAGPAAALSHASAGHLHRICPQPSVIHVLVPYSREVADQDGLVIHRSRRISDADIVAGTPPRTSVDRTLLDLLESRWSANGALGLIGDAIRNRLTTVERFRRVITAARCTKWRRVILEALPDVERGAQSPLELRDAAIRRRHGLPQGNRQVRRLSDGTEYLDVLIEEFGIHIELDGRLGHDATRDQWRDMRRDNRSVVRRLRHLRYGWADMFDRPCEVAIEQAVVLRQQGWADRFERCPACPPRLPSGLCRPGSAGADRCLHNPVG
jgi:hypothetical protein